MARATSRSRKPSRVRSRRIAQPQPRYAIGLGCEIKYASRLTYSMGLNLTDITPIGVNCRLCERINCSQRAEPPLTRELLFDETTRGVSPFLFSAAREL